jgi:hypothetical protein
LSIRTLQYKSRWFCYLDLLGFRNLVLSEAAAHVIELYDEVLAKLADGAEPKRPLGISYSWFSDTFIIFSRGDSLREFSLVEQAGRVFFQRLILKDIPVRGALTHGKLYSNVERNIFIGPALIDAYEYGEKQQWLGFILTPSVYAKLEGGELDVKQRWNYRRVSDATIITHPKTENVFAYAFLNSGENPFLAAIRRMKASAAEQHHKKYNNTEAFILSHAQLALSKAAT